MDIFLALAQSVLYNNMYTNKVYDTTKEYAEVTKFLIYVVGGPCRNVLQRLQSATFILNIFKGNFTLTRIYGLMV